MRVIYFYLLFSIVNHILSNFTHYLFPAVEVFVELIYTPIEQLFFAYFFYSILQNQYFKKIIFSSSILFLVFWLIFTFYKKEEIFDSVPTAVESLLTIVYSFFYFYEQIKNPDSLFIYSKANFWVVVSLLVYTSGTFFIFIYAQNWLNDNYFFKQFIYINATFYIVRNILLAISMMIKSDSTELKKHYREHWN